MVTAIRTAPVRLPAPLQPGDLIAVTAPSSGVEGAALARLDLVLLHLRSQGYRVVEGECLRQQRADASADATRRAHELMAFLTDSGVAAVLPPWGGELATELATELLDRLDFERLRSLPPKWLMGYSDLSTLMMPLTLLSGWATAHGPNLMDLAPTQTDPLTTSALRLLGSDWRQGVRQASSSKHQVRWTDFAERVDAPLNLGETTCWRRLDGQGGAQAFTGRLIGGCLDTLAGLAGTAFGDVRAFIAADRAAGTIVYLENAEMAPPALVRSLWSLRRHGWFDGVSGILIGRSDGPVPADPNRLGYRDALSRVLGDLACPVLVDIDIGHRPPQFTIINGLLGEVRFEDGGGTLTMRTAR